MLTLAQLIKFVMEEAYCDIPGSEPKRNAAITRKLGVLRIGLGILMGRVRYA